MKRFIKIFSTVRPFETFSVPSWNPRFSEPSFDRSPPTYQIVTRVIRRMKSAGSPCPLDKLSNMLQEMLLWKRLALS